MKRFLFVLLIALAIVSVPAVALAVDGAAEPASIVSDPVALLTSAGVVIALTEAIKRASRGRITNETTIAVAVAVGLVLNTIVYLFGSEPWFSEIVVRSILTPLAAVGGVTAISKAAPTTVVAPAVLGAEEIEIVPDEGLEA